MASEIDRISREISKKPVGEIERSTREIKEFCDAFVRLNGELIAACIQLDGKTSERMDKITEVLKEFRKKSAGTEEAWRLNQERFKEGLERDTFERKVRELTQDMASIKFDFDRCRLEIESFERQLASLIDKSGMTPSQPSVLPRRSSRIVEPEETGTESSAVSLADERSLPEVNMSKANGDADEFIKQGISFAESKKPEKAKECFENALKLRPNEITALYSLGRAESALGLHGDAIKNYKKVLETNPQHTGALYELGYSYGLTGKNKEAAKCYKQLLDFNPQDAKAWAGCGAAQYSSGRFKEAKESLEKAIEINPQYGLAWYNLGLVNASLGNERESKRCYEESAKLKNE